MESLCLDIMNSNKVDWQHSKTRHDMLDDEAWLQKLAETRAFAIPAGISDAELMQLKQLRSEMQHVVIKLRQEPDAVPDALSPINHILENVSFVWQLSYHGHAFRKSRIPDCEGWQLFIWSVAESFAGLLTERDLTRLKICDNRDCGWIFYDESKNKSRRWCDDKVCGNIMKVRNFRARKKEQSQ